jgi:DNA-binding winged helix-turn-helix (wHTH) protein
VRYFLFEKNNLIMLNNIIAIGTSVTLDLDTRMLTRTVDGKEVTLPVSACHCLKALVEAEGQVLTQEQLMDIGWRNSGVEVTENSVRVMINKIRRALMTLHVQDAIKLLAVTRSGYRLVIRTHPTLDSNPEQPLNGEEDSDVITPAINLPHQRPSVRKKLVVAGAAGLILGGIVAALMSLYFKVTPEQINYSRWEGDETPPNTEVWVPTDHQNEQATIRDTLELYNHYVVSREAKGEMAKYLYVTMGESTEYRGLIACATPLKSSENNCESYYFRYH